MQHARKLQARTQIREVSFGRRDVLLAVRNGFVAALGTRPARGVSGAQQERSALHAPGGDLLLRDVDLGGAARHQLQLGARVDRIACSDTQ